MLHLLLTQSSIFLHVYINKVGETFQACLLASTLKKVFYDTKKKNTYIIVKPSSQFNSKCKKKRKENNKKEGEKFTENDLCP